MLVVWRSGLSQDRCHRIWLVLVALELLLLPWMQYQYFLLPGLSENIGLVVPATPSELPRLNEAAT